MRLGIYAFSALFIAALVVPNFILSKKLYAQGCPAAPSADTLPPEVTENGYCTQVFDGTTPIPLADLSISHQPPLVPHNPQPNITQQYDEPGGFYSKTAGRWLVGHNGLDLGGNCKGSAKGREKVHNVLDGIVIASYPQGTVSGWGNTVCVASKANEFSTEIITTCYHHLDIGKRYVKPCDPVVASKGSIGPATASGEVLTFPGTLLGLEGDTGFSEGGAAHLHFTVRQWDNLKDLTDTLGYNSETKTFSKALQLVGNNGKAYSPKAINKDFDHLNGHLDPEGLLKHRFRDFKHNKNVLSLKQALNMRKLGIELGWWDGSFGTGELATKGEAAQWIKVAAELADAPGFTQFDDVLETNPYYPYVQTLTQYPGFEPVINPHNSCRGPDEPQSFCPDEPFSRAAALKMTILGFFALDFIKVYDFMFWQGTLSDVGALLSPFDDVDPEEWYAPYVYHGYLRCLFPPEEDRAFNPEALVTRGEMARWVMLSYNYLHKGVSPCGELGCTRYPDHPYCTGDIPEIALGETPTCIPNEAQDCAIGGGLGEGEPNPCDNPQCSPGEIEEQGCGAGGTQDRTCTESCEWSAWGICEGEVEGDCSPGEEQSCGNCGTRSCDGSGEWGACLGQGVCSPGATQDQPCNGVGMQSRDCHGSCHWGAWSSCTASCSPGQVDVAGCAGGGTRERTCNGSGEWGAWSACAGGGSECSPGETEEIACDYDGAGAGTGVRTRTCNAAGNWGGWGSCVADCTEAYIASDLYSCHDNPAGSGNPVLCLELDQIGDTSTWRYRICKEGEPFNNNISRELRDTNHTVILNNEDEDQTEGLFCSSWRLFNVSYIPGYGASNGVGAIAYISSPWDCEEAGCQYQTGGSTIRRVCE